MIECNGYTFIDVFGIAAVGPINRSKDGYTFPVHVRSTIVHITVTSSRGTSAIFTMQEIEALRRGLLADIQTALVGGL